MSAVGRRTKRHNIIQAIALAAALPLAVVLAAAPGSPAKAAAFTVTNGNATGTGSLRWAVNEANATDGVDTITFAESVQSVNLVANPLPPITEGIRIVGPGADLLIVGNEGVGLDVTLGNHPGEQRTVAISGLTASGFDIGIRVANATSVELGGVEIAAGRPVTITDSTGPVNVHSGQFNGNLLNPAEDGIEVRRVPGSVRVADSEVFRSAQNGIVIAEVGNATLDGVRLRQGEGGGATLVDVGTAVLDHLVVDGAGSAPAVLIDAVTTASLTDVTLRDGAARGLHAVDVDDLTVRRTGVATFVSDGISLDGVAAATLDHVTVTGTALNGTAHPVATTGGSLSLRHSTVAGNSSEHAVATFDGPGSATVSLHNTIATGNGTGGLVSGGASLTARYSVLPNAAPQAAQSTNQAADDPRLDDPPVGDTVALRPQAESPAVNLGDPDVAGYPPTDAAGNPRVRGGRVDIGAVETDVPSRAIVPVAPARYLDTRGDPTFDGTFDGGGRPAAGGLVEVPVAGRGSVPVDAVGVVANLAAILPSGNGWATLVPCTPDKPGSSHVNFAPGDVVANNTIVPLDGAGNVCIFAMESADYILDVNGYVPAGSPLELFPAERYLDTRAAVAAAAGEQVVVQVAGTSSVPAGASGAVVSVTAVDPQADGYVTLFPCTGSPTSASSLNYRIGQTVPNGQVVSLSEDGKLCIYTKAATHLLLEVSAYLPEDAASIRTVAPLRLFDSRAGNPIHGGTSTETRLAAEEFRVIQVGGRAGVPDTATAALLNVVTVGPDAAGYVTLWPCGPRPATSNLNHATGGALRANNAVTQLSDGGQVCVFTKSGADIVVDLTGWLE